MSADKKATCRRCGEDRPENAYCPCVPDEEVARDQANLRSIATRQVTHYVGDDCPGGHRDDAT